MNKIKVDVWLYGELARYGGDPQQTIFANLLVEMDSGSTVRNLLDRLQMPSEARGITFINGELSAMPGLQPDLVHTLNDGDRVAFFHLRSMWPFQYRFGVAMVDEMKDSLQRGEEFHHSYSSEEP